MSRPARIRQGDEGKKAPPPAQMAESVRIDGMSDARGAARKLLKALHLMKHPTYRRGLRYGIAGAIEHGIALRQLNLQTVIDVGANKGQFSLLSRALFPDAVIHAFEPLPGPAAKFRMLFAKDPTVTLHPCALGTTEGETLIHVSAREDSSSLFEILPRQNELFHGTAEIGTQIVDIRRGDDVIPLHDHLGTILIKLDVQGYELNALKGMPQLLERSQYVYTEISFVELYKGQALADEVIAFLSSRGLRFRGIYNLTTDKKGVVIQGDALFAR